MITMMKKQRYTAVLVSLMILLTAVFPCGTASAEQTGVVFGGWLILRSSPSFSGAIKSSYPSGTVVTITGKTGAWYAVKAPDGLTGYMLGDYLKVSGSGGGGGGTIPSGSKAYVTSSNGLNVRLRSGPGTGYSIIASYAPGTACNIVSSGKNWCRIQIGKLTGYMMTKFLTTSPVSPTTPPAPHPGTEYEVYVTSRNGKGVNLRSGPSKSYQSIGFYSVGTSAWMITRGSTWSRRPCAC
jgi:N-acetylmuramoyl-L-alanine amidase